MPGSFDPNYRLGHSLVPRAAMACLTSVVRLLALSASLAFASLAQQTPCLQRTLPVTVHDSHGFRMQGLTTADFQAKYRGQPVKILSIRHDNRPHRVVILLDTSGSMRGEVAGREWKMASRVAAHIGQSNLKNTSFALFVFSDSVREQIDFSLDNSAVANRLLDIWSDTSYAKKSVRGQTALLDAILSALRLLGDSRYSESVYVISDGGDNVSRSHLENVRNALASGGVRLHVTLLGPESRISPQEAASARDLADLAAESGGLVLGPLGLNRSGYDLPEPQRRALANQLSLMYLGMTDNNLIEIELPQSADKWRKWSLELSPATKKLYKDLLIVYPQQLSPCNARLN